MAATIIDGKKIAQLIKDQIKQDVFKLKKKGIEPCLAVILVGDNPASKVYVKNKMTACEQVGIVSKEIILPADIDEAALLATIKRCNHDDSIHGLLVQLPLPSHLDASKVIAHISLAKDVDGFHLQHHGAVVTGVEGLRPCTPWGIMKLLEHEQVPLRGAHAVVVGASNIVGKPVAMLLQNAGATVTICNSKTRDLSALTRMADIVVVAVGKPNFVTGAMIKPGALVIDVGINRLPDGKLVGDVEFDSVVQVASKITPVPGGVGPMTIAMLLSNTVQAIVHKMDGYSYATL
jgi:methylenetetrahydrofolate dehydrogenase (NADP+)/methenyltetrahydrofolate cyclohydrolase